MSSMFFGQFLLEQGAITGEQLQRAVESQNQTNQKLGARAVLAGFMTEDQATAINLMQRSVDKPFGQLAVSAGHLTEEQLASLLAEQNQLRLRLGEALVRQGALSSERAAEFLEAFEKQRQAAPETLGQSLQLCLDVTTSMYQRLIHTLVKPETSRTEPLPCDYIVHQRLTGDFDAVVGLNLFKAQVLLIACKILEMPPEEIDDELALDGAGEFINIISGNICSKLSELGKSVNLAPPVVLDARTSKYASIGQLTVLPLQHPESISELWVDEVA